MHFCSSAAQFPLSLKIGYENILLLLQVTSHKKLEYLEYTFYLKSPCLYQISKLAMISPFIRKKKKKKKTETKSLPTEELPQKLKDEEVCRKRIKTFKQDYLAIATLLFLRR